MDDKLQREVIEMVRGAVKDTGALADMSRFDDPEARLERNAQAQPLPHTMTAIEAKLTAHFRREGIADWYKDVPRPEFLNRLYEGWYTVGDVVRDTLALANEVAGRVPTEAVSAPALTPFMTPAALHV